MYEINQTSVADSFLALYVANGRPTLSREQIEARYEMCDELSLQVAEFCKTLQFSEDLSEEDALHRCHQGLLTPPATVSEAESGWVVGRVAELLTWDIPPWLDTGIKKQSS